MAKDKDNHTDSSHDHAGHASAVAEEAVTSTTEAVHSEAGHGKDPELLEVSAPMMIWTWITFAIVFVLLGKFAFKPILKGLEDREGRIRKSVDEAKRIEDELAGLEERCTNAIAEADEKAKDIISKAREGAVEASKIIEDKARNEAKILMDNAQRDIEAAQERAQATLRRESAEIAVALAGKIVNERLDDEKSRELTERLISEL
jgi:F-type H+-transporting ATPase subunit b